MPLTEHQATNTVSTQDWMKASENMRIRAYDSTSQQTVTETSEGFGTPTKSDSEDALRKVRKKRNRAR